jgi:hypothetical protein
MNFKELPSPIPNSRTWGALEAKKGYVIFEDEGKFTASYRRVDMGVKTVTVYIIDYADRVDTFEEAVLACEQADKEQ